MSMAEDMGIQVACSWCGLHTPVGPACERCGSPMEELTQCRYCGALTPDAVCATCQGALSTMSTLARNSPKQLLDQALTEILDRAPSP
jgi:hypothetical protein